MALKPGVKKKPAAKKKMQNVSFKSLEEFFDYLPASELRIVEVLRDLVFECIPDCKEKLSYNVPYYKRHYNICFIWPPSVQWSGALQRGVRFGFTSGYLLHDETGYLDKGDRKQVYWKDFTSIREIDSSMLRNLLFEAALIDSKKVKR